MKLLHTEITPLVNNSLYIDYRSQPFLACPFHEKPCFHAHPEFELVYILEGYGKRIIGDTVEPFEAGDMVLIGSNVPHVWLSDAVFYEAASTLQSRVIVTYFNARTFQQMFDAIREFGGIKDMISQASQGIRIFGETRQLIAEKLMALTSAEGFEKVEGLLRIMHMISISREKTFIARKDVARQEGQHSDRLMDIIGFIKKNLHEPILLRQVADVAFMTEQSLCRFFKKRTKMSISQYVLELRMANAKKILIEQDKPVSDIAALCGYNSSSRFCKVFKDYTGQSPYKYKTGFRRDLQG